MKKLFAVLVFSVMLVMSLTLSSFSSKEESNLSEFASSPKNECWIRNFAGSTQFQWGTGSSYAMYTNYNRYGQYAGSGYVSVAFAQSQCNWK